MKHSHEERSAMNAQKVWNNVFNLNSIQYNSHCDQLSVALIAQLVKHWTGIVEIRSANLVQAYFFKKISSVTQIILPDFVLFWL